MKQYFSREIFLTSMRKKIFLWTIVTIVVCIFVIINSIPLEMDGRLEHLLSYMRIYHVFGFYAIFFVTVLITIVVTSNSFAASEVSDGTMLFILNTPITRKQVIVTRLIVQIMFITILVLLMGILMDITLRVTGAYKISEGFPIDFKVVWIYVLAMYLYSLAVGSIAFAASCYFNSVTKASAVVAVILLTFFFVTIFSSIYPNNQLSSIRILSLMSFYDLENFGEYCLDIVDSHQIIIFGLRDIIALISMALVSIVLYLFGVVKFINKDLPI